MRFHSFCLAALALWSISLPCLSAPSAKPARAVAPAVAAPERIEVSPSDVQLTGRRALRQFVVTGWVHGEPRDLTSSAEFHVGDEKVARMAGSRITAVTNGRTVLTLHAGGRTVRIPVTVAKADAVQPVSFQFETVPILTKQGCATGSCHGSPHGKGGFSLSLYGYDPNIDRISLTRDGFNRRINVMEPADSLMLKKPLLEIPHMGGKRLHKQDAGFAILRDWIFEGANADVTKTECRDIALTPNSSRVLESGHMTQQISASALFSDGTARDVTPIATFETSNPAVATVDANGLVTGHARGQCAISVRYLDKLLSVYITVVEKIPGFAWTNPPENNSVDTLVDAKLKQLQYLPSETCSDPVFVRRVCLDLTGLLPSAEQALSFLADKSPEKRAKLIDTLIDSEEFARFWALKKADLMRLTPARLKNGRADKFGEWLVDAVRSNMPYDQFARTLLTASGDTTTVAPANYFLAIPTMEERTEMTAQIFMGSRLECTKCHNHPFEKWTMRDYYSLAAVFARTRSDNGMITLAASGEAEHPTTHETMIAWGETPAEITQNGFDRRIAFADWLTKPGNPYFARVEVNRIWAELMGRGIVDPVDDFRSSNPPSNVPLLDALAKEFEKSGFDRKRIVRLICNSRAYQRSSQTGKFNEGEETLFSHAHVRMLTAEQLKDAMGLATGALSSPEQIAAKLAVLKKQNASDSAVQKQIASLQNRTEYATQRPYSPETQFALSFGQPKRETACTCERQHSPTLLQALELLNGDTGYRLAQSGAARYAALDDNHLIDDLYMSALSRVPTEKERATAKLYITKGRSRQEAVTDLVWTILNTREFLFQH